MIAVIKDHHVRLRRNGDRRGDAAARARSRSPICRTILHRANRCHRPRRVFAPCWSCRLLAADRIVGALVVRRKAPGEFSQEHGRSAADLRRTVGAGDPECAPVRGDRGEEPPACNGKRAQVAVRLQRQPRTAHPAQCHHWADRDDGHQRGALRHGESRRNRCSA